MVLSIHIGGHNDPKKIVEKQKNSKNTSTRELRPMEQLAQNLIRNLKDYFLHNGFTRAVVGLSGGVDSAVTAALAVRALGAENVTGLLLPHSAFSSETNLADAAELGEILQIKTQKIEIDAFAQPFLNLSWATKELTRGNIFARVRMTILYSWANEHQALVIGTCNKSETLLGYETKFGDGASDVAVIGDLWKTEVWQLVKVLGLPEKLMTKAPSAELFHDHTDEGELGFSYHFADEILQKWEQGEKLPQDDPHVQEILRRIAASEHKRNIAPVISRN